MNQQQIENYRDHPLFSSAMQHFQEGVWQASLREVEWLMEHFPLEQELRALRQDLILRAQIDIQEVRDEVNAKKVRVTTYTSRALVAGVVAVIVILGFQSISSVIQEKVEVARTAIKEEIFLIEQSAKFRDAEALLRADRPSEALSLLEEIANRGADFPGLQPALMQAFNASMLQNRYAEATNRIEFHEWGTARIILEEIAGQEPNYRDVPLLLANLDNLSYISEIFDQAEIHNRAQEWEQAASGYENLRVLDPNFQSEIVEDRLFTSYVNAAREVLVRQADSLEALKLAESYFRKALVLRPQNPKIKTERELARFYLDAQANFLQGRWTDVIAGLEVINSKDPNYAAGTARQTFYEAYIARGDSRMESGEYESALEDFQRAVILAEQDGEAVLRLYEALLKAADAQGAQDNYEAAVLLYRSAVELSNLRLRAAREDPAQAAILEKAENYANLGNYSVAYERYRIALGIVPGNYCNSFDPYQEALHLTVLNQAIKTHVVQEGEYLTLLANRYHSTVCAIALASKISDPNVIILGQELRIPVLP